jgi:hypothetical protein
MKRTFLLFVMILYWYPNLIAQGNNEVNWFVFDNGFAVQNNSSTISFSLTGQTAAGTTAINNNNIIIGFLSELAIRGSITSMDDEKDNSIPLVYDLYQNYPNPFNPVTIIKYQIPKEGLVVLKIYDLLGNEVKTLLKEEKPAGIYELNFDAGNLASGIYLYRIQVNDYKSTRKMMLVK